MEDFCFKIVYVCQVLFLFFVLIVDNIVYGILEGLFDCQLYVIVCVVEVVGLYDFILLFFNGYIMLVGDGGQFLFGG